MPVLFTSKCCPAKRRRSAFEAKINAAPKSAPADCPVTLASQSRKPLSWVVTKGFQETLVTLLRSKKP